MKVDKYKYSMEPLMITVPGKNEPIFVENNRIHSVTIDRDFDNNLMPFISIELSINKADHIAIISNLNKTLVSFKMTKVRFNKDKDYNFKQSFIDRRFNILTDNVSPDNSSDIDDSSKDKKSNDAKTESDQQINCKFILIDSQVLSRFKKTYNIATDSANAITILGYIFGESGFKSLISPLDSTSTKRVLIPESNVQDIVEYVHRNLGIYNTGYRMFNDVDDVLYFLNNENDSKAYVDGDYNNIYFDISTNSSNDGINYGSFVENGAYKISCGAKDVQYKSSSAVAKELNPTKIRAITGTGVTETSTSVGGFDSGDNVMTIEDKRNNPCYIKSILSKSSQTNLSVTIAIPEIDISYITANKKYNLNYKDDIKMNQSYAGTYKCSRVISRLSREDDYLVSNNIIELKRV